MVPPSTSTTATTSSHGSTREGTRQDLRALFTHGARNSRELGHSHFDVRISAVQEAIIAGTALDKPRLPGSIKAVALFPTVSVRWQLQQESQKGKTRPFRQPHSLPMAPLIIIFPAPHQLDWSGSVSKHAPRVEGVPAAFGNLNYLN